MEALVSPELRRDIIVGGLAGLVGGLALVWPGVAAGVHGLLDLDLGGPAIALHILVTVPLGAAFGAVFRYQPRGYASLISNGLLFALLLWVIGPLTLSPIVAGDGPTWSAMEARDAFSTLIAHLLYGGLTGLGFYTFVTLHSAWRPRPEVEDVEETVTRVVILGGGFGGISTAQRLEQIFWRRSDFEIVVVSHSNYLLFTPMLAEVAASALEPQHISSPVRAALPRTRFYHAVVDTIDADAQAVRFRAGSSRLAETVHYDHLVLALGSVPNYFGLPGMEEHSFTLKTLEDATQLRNHVIAQLEQADVTDDPVERRKHLSFVVAGGGFAGTEMVAEMFDLVHSVLRYYPSVPRQELRFMLIHSRDRILPELGPELADYAMRKLEARGIEFLLNTRVAGAGADGVLLSEEETIPAHTVVWTAGNQPNPVLESLPCERTRAGAVVAEPTLQVKGYTNVWVVGDCGHIPVPDREGEAYPPTAQHAIREGKTAASNIAALMQARPLKPFRFRTLGMLVPLGHRTGVAEIRGLRFSGLLAWLMWRGLYLGLLPGLEKKVRVLFDWLIDLFFPRDIVLTAETRTPTMPQMLEAGNERGVVSSSAVAAEVKESSE